MSNWNFVYERMIETLKNSPFYKEALTVQQIQELKPPSPEWLKDNEVRQLTHGKYVDLMRAITINRELVDEQLHQTNEALERYDNLRWQVDRLIQFINITITGDMDARVLQKAIQQTVEELSLNSSNESSEVKKQ